SPAVIPPHTPGTDGVSRATHLCVSLVAHFASDLSGDAASLKPRLMSEILLALLRPAVVTRLVLGTYQAVGTAATVGHTVQVATGSPDRILHVTTPAFGGLEGPTLAVGISQETAEFAAMRTPARDITRPCPIAWRL